MNHDSSLLGLGLTTGLTLLIIVIAVAVAILNGIALWKAARNGSKGWFIALFLTNTLILELLYIFVFSKEQDDRVTDYRPPRSVSAEGQHPSEGE